MGSKVVDNGVAETGVVDIKTSDLFNSGMVNGDNDDSRKKSENLVSRSLCDEKGDAGLGRGILGGLSSKWSNRDRCVKQTSSMGVCIKDEKLLPPVESGDCSKFGVQEPHMEEKMNEE